ncbi:hypothetical protein [Alkalihalobacillus sp. AL-G]|uniref:hypothetical protein n=1 Tax=Alkalihalobacillus sp. AL-G TaxID=2926399 RepID=UPI00272B7B6C|nr:hypothetical protein [Alkalihalobacillus sp. AL-G]WLD94082.1 hypothetical protein MOJ78_04065 [Alkalihalobacillus sp. AL-G]
MYRENKPIDVSPYDHPDIYPGPRPSSSFIYYEGKAHRIIEQKGVATEELIVEYSDSSSLLGSFAEHSNHRRSIGEFLHDEELLPIEERVPLVAYGSNVCLAQLRYKFNLNKGLNDFVLCLRGAMLDSDIVYGSFLAPYGSLPAIIAPVKEAVTEIWVTFVDPEQLEHMNRTEGGYVLREHKDEKIITANSEWFSRVYAYYYPHALELDDQWFRFRDIKGKSRLTASWQADMLDKMKQKFRFSGTREEFIHQLRWNTSFYREMQQWLKQFDCKFEHPDWVEPEFVKTCGEIKRSLLTNKSVPVKEYLSIYSNV